MDGGEGETVEHHHKDEDDTERIKGDRRTRGMNESHVQIDTHTHQHEGMGRW